MHQPPGDLDQAWCNVRLRPSRQNPLTCSKYPPLVIPRTRTALHPSSVISFAKTPVGTRPTVALRDLQNVEHCLRGDALKPIVAGLTLQPFQSQPPRIGVTGNGFGMGSLELLKERHDRASVLYQVLINEILERPTAWSQRVVASAGPNRGRYPVQQGGAAGNAAEGSRRPRWETGPTPSHRRRSREKTGAFQRHISAPQEIAHIGRRYARDRRVLGVRADRTKAATAAHRVGHVWRAHDAEGGQPSYRAPVSEIKPARNFNWVRWNGATVRAPRLPNP
jgi:hypothetical protein